MMIIIATINTKTQGAGPAEPDTGPKNEQKEIKKWIKRFQDTVACHSFPWSLGIFSTVLPLGLRLSLVKMPWSSLTRSYDFISV